MTCEETHRNISLYVDDRLSEAARLACEAHIGKCPVCQKQLIETRRVVRRLRALTRPVAPPELIDSVSNRLSIERGACLTQPALPVRARIEQWIAPRAMPYTVGMFASLLLFVLAYGVLRPHFVMLRELEIMARTTVSPVPVSSDGSFDINQPISLEGYAASRTLYAAESPSLNPSGALAVMTRTPARGEAGDDDMIVVADVYSNGDASLAEIVQPPRNQQALDELVAALRRNPAFVPSSLDRRPETMRVVFVLQKVDVQEQGF